MFELKLQKSKNRKQNSDSKENFFCEKEKVYIFFIFFFFIKPFFFSRSSSRNHKFSAHRELNKKNSCVDFYAY